MKDQLAFLLCLGAFENRHMIPDKIGISNTLSAYPANERLWREAGRSGTLQDAIYETVERLKPDVLAEAVDGTLFPAESECNRSVARDRWNGIVAEACREIRLRVCDADEESAGRHGAGTKENLIAGVMEGNLIFVYFTPIDRKRLCLLTDEQVVKLAWTRKLGGWGRTV